MSSPGQNPNDLALELYKLEYERAAIRFEDIYKAIWQIFSYLAAISGALLAFGSDRLELNVIAFLACAPLVFWFWGTFWPLNRYGDLCLDRLVVVENELNSRYQTKLSHYTEFKKRRAEGLRVRYIVYVFIGMLHLAFLAFGWSLVKLLCCPK